MTTTPRIPEQFILVGPDQAWATKTMDLLKQEVKKSPKYSFFAWRLDHGLIKVINVDDLDAKLSQAFANAYTPLIQPNETYIFTELASWEWEHRTKNCITLKSDHAREISVQILEKGDLRGFIYAADWPDARYSLFRMMAKPCWPINRKDLPLQPLLEFSEQHNESMAKAGYDCYDNWTKNLLTIIKNRNKAQSER